MSEFPSNNKNSSPTEKEKRFELKTGLKTLTSFLHEQKGEPNEDAAYLNKAAGIIAVFDGVGGAPAGHLASREARSVLDPALSNDLIQPFFENIETPLTEAKVKQAGRTLLKRMTSKLTDLSSNPDPDLQKAISDYAAKRFSKSLQRELDPSNPQDQSYFELAASAISTTVSMAKLWTSEDHKHYITTFQIGDSSVYRLRSGKLEKITKDDSYITSLVDAKLIPSEAEYSTLTADNKEAPDYIQLTIKTDAIKNMKPADPNLLHIINLLLDSPEEITVESIRRYVTLSMNNKLRGALAARITTTEAEDGDVFLAMTDGITDNLTHQEMTDIIERAKGSPEHIATLLTTFANQRSMSTHPRAKLDDMTVSVMAIV
ncbi:MAG: protein phosphatase 2C domain-containing protein [Candidatus Nomurabacteria bacterium]|nr:MAG: protein phosphatase 2C domain-containing protein [Candidatus Nomurabacteria bacterium]